jgi:hypothetical protein
MLNEGSPFDSAVKKYLKSYLQQESTEKIINFDKIIEQLSRELKDVPSFNSDDLFDPNRNKHSNISNAIEFFKDLKHGYDNSTLIRKRTHDVTPFPENPLDLYKVLNAPGHPVRDGLILLNGGLL